MKKFALFLILVFTFNVLVIDIAESKTNATKKVTVTSYRKGKNGRHYHSTYKKTVHYNKSKKGK